MWIFDKPAFLWDTWGFTRGLQATHFVPLVAHPLRLPQSICRRRAAFKR